MLVAVSIVIGRGEISLFLSNMLYRLPIVLTTLGRISSITPKILEYKGKLHNMMKTFVFYILERFSMCSWWSDLEITRCIIGLLNKVQLCIFRHLSKEHCIAVYLFSKWFLARRKKCGWRSFALYLKASAVCLRRYYTDSFDKHEALPFPVSLTRLGLPPYIPSFHRKRISMKADRGDRIVLKFYLSIFSLSKPILVGKKMNYQYKSIVSPPTSLPTDLIVDIQEKVVEFAE